MNERAAANKSDAKRWSTPPRQHTLSLPQSDASPVGEILHLQQSIGNQVVQRLFESGIIQTKLTVGRPDDVYEQEADRVAGEVMRMPEPKACCESVNKEDEHLRRKETSGVTPELTEDAEQTIQSFNWAGNALPDSVGSYMEPPFGVDFGSVRVPTDTRAAESARAIDAEAFTLGRDIIFGEGRYFPDTSEGKRCMIGNQAVLRSLRRRCYARAAARRVIGTRSRRNVMRTDS